MREARDVIKRERETWNETEELKRLPGGEATDERSVENEVVAFNAGQG